MKDRVYKYPNTGTGVTVYNTDSELNTDHVAFEGRAKSGYDFVDEDPNVNECKNPLAKATAPTPPVLRAARRMASPKTSR